MQFIDYVDSGFNFAVSRFTCKTSERKNFNNIKRASYLFIELIFIKTVFSFYELKRKIKRLPKRKPLISRRLLLNDCVIRTCICTSAALKTYVRIYYIDVFAFRDSVHRALTCTCAARNTFICDFISHFIHLRYLLTSFYHYLKKMQLFFIANIQNIGFLFASRKPRKERMS